MKGGWFSIIREKLKTGVPAAALLVLLLYLLASPAAASRSVTEALGVCAGRLIPSLFPFLVLTGLLSGSGAAGTLAAPFAPLFERVFRLDGCGAAVFLLGAVGGFPLGAVMTAGLLERGMLADRDAELLCCISNNAGPAFCIGVIGAGLRQDPSFGRRVWLCQLAAAAVIGLILRPSRRPRRTGDRVPAVSAETPDGTRSKRPRRTGNRGPVPRSSDGSPHLTDRSNSAVSSPRVPLTVLLGGAVSSAGNTMLKICSFAVFFAVIGNAACPLIERFGGRAAAALAGCLCELTLGCRLSASLTGQPVLSGALTAFAAGCGGFSVLAQLAAVLNGCKNADGIRFSRLVFSKLTQGLLSAVFFTAVQRFFP